MTNIDNLSVGDEVEVKFTGTVLRIYSNQNSATVRVDGGETQYLSETDGFTTHVIKKAVEVFKPGDVLRHSITNAVYTLLPNGKYFNHLEERVCTAGISFKFTSDWYERLS